MLTLAMLTILSWTPVARPVTVEAWVRRPTLLECGQDEPCLEYQTVYYKWTEAPADADHVEWQHPLEPGDILYYRFPCD